MTRYVYFFGDGRADGKADMKNTLGGKGANLAEMSRLGLPVPPGFTISTDMCWYFAEHDGYPDSLQGQLEDALSQVERVMGARFGDPDNPLLLSIRSGAAISMPGMMDTILNLGCNDSIVQGIIRKTDNPRFAFDCYRRLIQMYGDVVLDLKPHDKHDRNVFEELLEDLKSQRDTGYDTELHADDWQALVRSYQAVIKESTGLPFPQDPREQLWESISAVFRSWNNERAVTYRRLNGIPESLGTAVNVQAMVYGNANDTCATGVAFTRNPIHGENRVYGEYLINAQGEDVVAGIRTPQPLSIAQKSKEEEKSLEEIMPESYHQLLQIFETLEENYRDMQDVEFTVEYGRLWMLQTRTGKRTGLAAVRMAIEMEGSGLIDRETALLRIDPGNHLNQLLQPIFSTQELQKATTEGRCIASGLAAGPGAATGHIVFSAEDALDWVKRGESVILVRHETSPEDISGMAVATGFLTARGGSTSHASLVARQMGKVCVAGCHTLHIDYPNQQMTIEDRVFRQGDSLSLDGFLGHVYEGRIETQPSEVIQVLVEGTLAPEDAPTYQMFAQLMSWSNDVRKLKVFANADQPEQARLAVAFGAEGLGLCRTEHMFFGEDRIHLMQEMIVAQTVAGRKEALDKLLPLQENDFYELFKVLEGRSVTIRLLDPPLHEFLPHEEEQMEDLANILSIPSETLEDWVDEMAEANPMLGHRGCRLLLTYPEIAEMQITAIMQAACRAQREGCEVKPEIMVPLVSLEGELIQMRKLISEVANRILEEQGIELHYQVGTMIELPRACMIADKLAEHAEFFSFGTNDLTQATFGYSRDDAGHFLDVYKEQGLLSQDPFQTLDRDGVGEFIRMAFQKGRQSRPDLLVGLCGEHGGDPRSIEFCHELGLSYVSCSPYRIPIAIVASAKAAISGK